VHSRLGFGFRTKKGGSKKLEIDKNVKLFFPSSVLSESGSKGVISALKGTPKSRVKVRKDYWGVQMFSKKSNTITRQVQKTEECKILIICIFKQININWQVVAETTVVAISLKCAERLFAHKCIIGF